MVRFAGAVEREIENRVSGINQRFLSVCMEFLAGKRFRRNKGKGRKTKSEMGISKKK